MTFLRRFTQHAWFVPGLMVVVTVLIAAPILTYPMGRDQGMYANIARGILQGKPPFIGYWDIKPPIIYYLYALDIALFGKGAAALRMLDLMTVPITILGLYWLGLRLGNRRVAFLATVLFPVFYFTETFASLTQSDAVVTLPMTLAVVSVVKVGDYPRGSRPALFWSAAAGALSAVSIWFKQYYALFVIALVIHHVLVRRALPLKEALAFCLGGLPVGLIPLLYFASNGVLQEMIYVFQGTAKYNAQAAASFETFIAQMSNYVRFRWWHWGVLLILVAPWPLVAFLTRKSRKAGWRVVVFWLVSGLAFVLIQAKGFDTHWIPMLPPLVLFGAEVISRLLDWLTDKVGHFIPHYRYTFSLAATILVALLLYGILIRGMWVRAWPYLTGQETLMDYYGRFQGNDLKPAESLAMVEFLKERVAPGDTLFIWGFRPEVYYLAELTPATRFIAHFPLVGDYYPAEWKQEAVDTLWAAMPPYVLVLQADYMPWVTGYHEDSHELLVMFTELSNWLSANYTRDETQIGNFLIWRRNSE